MRLVRGFFIAFSTFLFVSCTAPSPRPADAQLQQLWQEHEAMLSPIQHWELRGRLAVRADEQGGQAALVWRRDGTRHGLRLSGPLGRGLLQLTQDESGAQLQDAEQRVLYAPSAEELLFRYSGWRLPVENLNYWVRGLPVPGVAMEQELDDSGQLKTLRQEAWEVQYQEYVLVEGRSLPRRLRLTNPRKTAEQPAMEVRLVIERWAQVQ